MMINNPTEPPQEDKTTFATNWYQRADEIFQLLVSDHIWKKNGFDVGTTNITKIQQTDTQGIVVDDDEDVIMTYEFNPHNAKWTLYAKGED